ncbi:MAG: 3-deoxy-8-phosphooctulonate synthase [Saprospiraceae bacterium]|nr:3-deoxy-8-phosphooctulonate synthase [Saprospiraceae bacterium]
MTTLGSIPLIRHFRPDSFVLMAGPCVVENEEICFEIAESLCAICDRHSIPFIFKASYRKANRSKADSFSGIGDEAALKILAKIRAHYQVPVLTDIHTEAEASLAADYVDVLQIPAFLCRQTSLLEAAAQTGKWINIKKGQFLSPDGMKFALDKVVKAGNDQLLITERGTTFGYQDLVVDFRGFPLMRSLAPLILDCTHSLQRPNQNTGITGGQPQLIEVMARAGIAAGVDGLFIETHPRPEEALSDGANMLPMGRMESLIVQAISIQKALLPS